MFVSHLHGDHFGGLPFLILDGQFSRRAAPLLIVGPPGTRQRLTVSGTVIAYTGDTAWTPAITQASRDADLLIAEAYCWDRPVPHYLRYADLTEHEITARRVILTHMSADMFARPTLYETARDGLAIRI